MSAVRMKGFRDNRYLYHGSNKPSWASSIIELMHAQCCIMVSPSFIEEFAPDSSKLMIEAFLAVPIIAHRQSIGFRQSSYYLIHQRSPIK